MKASFGTLGTSWFQRCFIYFVAFATAFSNIGAPFAVPAAWASSTPTFTVSTWKDGQDKIVLEFDQPVATLAGAALSATEFTVSGANAIGISSVDHEAYDEEVIVTLATNLNSAANDFSVSCVASSVYNEDGADSCASAVTVGVYTAAEDTTGPSMDFIDFVSATDVAVEFDEIVDATTLIAGNFTLATSDTLDDSTIDSVMTFDRDGILLGASLANIGFGTGNTISVTAGVMDIVGNAAMAATETILPLIAISETRLESSTSDKDEFIELYNASEADFDMGSTGAQTVYLHIWDGTTDTEVPLSIYNAIIPASGYYLIGTSYTDTGAVSLDATYSTATTQLGADGAVYLSFSATADTDVVDLVGWGTSTLSEGDPATEPAVDQSLERKAEEDATAASMASGGEHEFSGNGEDENDNAADFVVQTPVGPQNSSSAIEFSSGSGFNEGGDTESPSVYYSYPSAESTYVEAELDEVVVLFTETMDSATLDTTSVTLVSGADHVTNLCSEVNYDPYSIYGSYLTCVIDPLVLPLDNAETYTFTIDSTAADIASNIMLADYTFDFTVTEGYSYDSSNAPYVWGSYPYNGDSQFTPNTFYLYLYFSQEMDTTTLTATNITLQNTTDSTNVTLGTITPFSDWENNDSVYIDVSAVDFEEGEDYALTVSASVMSIDGVAMGLDEVISFTVASGDDTSAPVVTGSYPSDGETDVPVGNDYIDVAVDDVLDSTTVTTDTVKLALGADEVPIEVAYSAAYQMIWIDFNAVLEANSTYEIQLTADPTVGAIANNSGLALSDTDGTTDGIHRISFTTGDPDTEPPYVYYAMSTQSRLYVTFSEGMNEDTVEDVANYTLESPDGTPVSLTALGGQTATYDNEDNTVTIEGISLTPDNSFTVTVANVTDASGNPIDANNDTGSGTVYDEAEYDPGDDTYSDDPWDMANGYEEDEWGYVPQPYVYPYNSLAGFESSYYIYVPITQQIPSDAEGGQVIIEFPVGTDVSNVGNPDWSWSNGDVNYDSPGTVAVSTVTADPDAYTVTITFTEATGCDDGNVEPCADTSDMTDYISLELEGIVNPTTPRGYDTDGYSLEVQTMDDSTLLESFISYPFYISEGGDNTLTVNLTAPGAEAGTMEIEGWGYSTGSFVMESDAFVGGVATAIQTGLPDGDYWLWTDSMIDLDDDGTDDYVVETNWLYLTVNGDATTDMTFVDVDSLASVTVNVTGLTGKNIDIYASGPSWSWEQIESTSGNDDVEFYLQDGQWWISIWPHYDDAVGYVTPDYIVSPQDVYVSVEGGEVEEDSGTSDDGVVEIALVAADNEIPFLVVDQDALPIANAWVWLSDVDGGFWTYGQTAIDGTITLAVNDGTFHSGVYVEGMPSSQDHTIVVNDTGEIFVDGSDTAITLVTLEVRVPTNAISGTVSDGTNPVSGASVYAFCTDDCAGYDYSWASTDSNGAFTFYVDNGTWQVGAYIPGYGYAEEQIVVINNNDQSGVTLAPDPDAVYYTISGTVCEVEQGATDCTGVDAEPLENVYISVWTDDPNGRWNSTTSSVDGTYSIRVLAATGYVLDVWDSSLGSLVGLSGIDASVGDVVGADILVTDPFEVSLRLVDDDGNAFVTDGIWAEAVNVDTGGHAYFWIEGTDTGTVELPAGDWELELWASEANLDSDNISSDSADTVYTDGILTVDGVEALVIQMPALYTVDGTVTDDDGNEIVDAWVELMEVGSDMYNGDVTDDTGAFSMSVESGTYQMMVYYPGLVIDPTEIEVTADVTVDFSGTIADRTISGSVENSDGDPVPYAYVMGEDSDGTIASAQADGDGVFELWVTDETWTLTAFGYGWDESGSEEVEVNGVDVAGVVLTLGAEVDLADPLSVSVTPAAGGVVDNDDAGVEVLIPENALGTSSDSNSTVTVTETNNTPENQTTDVIGNGVDVDVTDSTGAAITQFSDELTYTWTMTVAELAAEGIDTQEEVESITISYYDSSGAWIFGATTVTYYAADDSVIPDPEDDLSDVSYVEFTAAFDHATVFALTTSSDAVSAAADTGGDGGGGGGGGGRTTTSDEDEEEVAAEEETGEAEAEAEEAKEAVSAEAAADEQIAQILAEADVESLASAATASEAMGVARSLESEISSRSLIVKNISESDLPDDADATYALVNFVAYGTASTESLGAGERAGVLNSYRAAFGDFPMTDDEWADVLKIAGGRWPSETSESAEWRATVYFRTIYLRDPDMTNANDNAAVTVIAYGLRPANRNLGSEATAIGYFRDIFGLEPSSATSWDIVRAIAYSGATR